MDSTQAYLLGFLQEPESSDIFYLLVRETRLSHQEHRQKVPNLLGYLTSTSLVKPNYPVRVREVKKLLPGQLHVHLPLPNFLLCSSPLHTASSWSDSCPHCSPHRGTSALALSLFLSRSHSCSLSQNLFAQALVRLLITHTCHLGGQGSGLQKGHPLSPLYYSVSFCHIPWSTQQDQIGFLCSIFQTMLFQPNHSWDSCHFPVWILSPQTLCSKPQTSLSVPT